MKVKCLPLISGNSFNNTKPIITSIFLVEILLSLQYPPNLSIMISMEQFKLLSFLCILTCYSQTTTNFISPLPYTCVSSIFVDSSKSMYYHSGVTYDGSYLLGLRRFYYDEVVSSWRSEEQQLYNTPDPRSFYGSFLYNNSYYIFGGIGPNGIYNDIWSYDLLYQRWTEIVVPQPISPRYSFAYTSFTYQDTFYFAVLGGNTFAPCLDPGTGFKTGTGLFEFYL